HEFTLLPYTTLFRSKKELDEKGIKPSAVSGTGKAGRITKEDAVKAKPSMGTPGPGKRGEKRERMSMMRRKTAERLVESQNTAAIDRKSTRLNSSHVS